MPRLATKKFPCKIHFNSNFVVAFLVVDCFKGAFWDPGIGMVYRYWTGSRKALLDLGLI